MIKALATEFWEGTLKAHPMMATILGDHRYDGDMPDNTLAGARRELERLDDLRQRALATPEAGVDTEQRITRAMLINELSKGISQIRAGLWEWSVDPLGGPQVELPTMAHLQTVATRADADAMVLRWHRMAHYLDAQTEHLRRSLAAGKVATRDATARVVRQLEELNQTPTEQWTLLRPAKEARPSWSESERDRFAQELRRAVESSIRPAFERYLKCVRDEILPHTRPQDRVGLKDVPEGEAAYRDLIRVHTSLDLSAKEIHEFGLEEVGRVRGEMQTLGGRVLGAKDLPDVLSRLRGDRSLFFAQRDEVQSYAEESLKRALDAMPNWFGRLPKAGCEVRRIESYEEKDSTIAYYRQPATDGSRPGTYYINTYAPETRPRYEAQALAYHESVPGHHLQIAIAQEIGSLPEFRRHLGVTAYVEGWALYTERLSDEMGLYSDDFDRIGMLSFDAWRACRLVVDTGIHAFGWSRQKAIDFMVDNTALGRNNIENEVDRYITWPGQALSYKIGQREFLRLRKMAEERLGSRFDIRAFHDCVLENGAVSLGILRQQVEEWVARA